MVTKLMLRNYTACKVYAEDSEKNRKTVAAVDKFLAYCERHNPAMKIAAVEKYINGRPWKDIALDMDRTEKALSSAFYSFLEKYNNTH